MIACESENSPRSKDRIGHSKKEDTFSNDHAPKMLRDRGVYHVQKRPIGRIKRQENSENSMCSHNVVRKCPLEDNRVSTHLSDKGDRSAQGIAL
jgi:hypothetical protein